MLGIEYFGNSDHYCFEKYDISDLASDVVLFFDFLNFFISCFCFWTYFRSYLMK